MIDAIDAIFNLIIAFTAFCIGAWSERHDAQREREGEAICPHCLATISTNTKTCPDCGGDTT